MNAKCPSATRRSFSTRVPHNGMVAMQLETKSFVGATSHVEVAEFSLVVRRQGTLQSRATTLLASLHALYSNRP